MWNHVPAEDRVVTSSGISNREDREEGVSGVNNRSIYVGNLPWSCDWKMLKDSFSSVFPDVVYADVATQGGAPGARSYGWGTVRFSSRQSRDNAIQRFNGKNMGGRNIEVRVDRGRTGNNY